MKFKYFKGDFLPEHFTKLKEFECSLVLIESANKQEFSKELYTSENFITLGIHSDKPYYNIHQEVPDNIREELVSAFESSFT